MLVAELRRVTVLWDELWLGVLLQQHMYVLRRIQQLEDEVKRVQNNNTLRKYVLFFNNSSDDCNKCLFLRKHTVKPISSGAAPEFVLSYLLLCKLLTVFQERFDATASTPIK